MINEEGIVLKSIDFRDHQKIITLYTPQLGIISAIVKNLSQKKLQEHSLCSPLVRAQYILKKGRSECYGLIEGSVIDLHLELRRSLAVLTISLNMIKTISQTQLPGKPSQELYQLLKVYLKELKKNPYANQLLMSFYLKLLKYEGVFIEEAIPSSLKYLAHIQHFDEIQERTISEEDELIVKNLMLCYQNA